MDGQFFRKKLLYLGHRVSSEGIGTDPEKVVAIAELEPPSTVSELRQYLGVASWYRRFVPDFAKIVKPLNDLQRKSNKWVWRARISTSHLSCKLTRTTTEQSRPRRLNEAKR